MDVVVKKKALIEAIRIKINENTEEDVLSDAFSDDTPVSPTPQMSTQFSVDMPDVGDPDFIPVNIDELSRSAYMIAAETPSSQIEWFYRKLHEMLDDALGRDDTDEDLQESIRRVISAMSESNDDDENLIQGKFEPAYQKFFEKINEDQEMIQRVGRILFIVLERYITNLKHENEEMAEMELDHYGELIPILKRIFGTADITSQEKVDVFEFPSGDEDLKEGNIRKLISLLIENEDDDDDDFDYSGLESVGRISAGAIALYMSEKGYATVDLVDPDTGTPAMRPDIQHTGAGAAKLVSKQMRVTATKSEARRIVIEKISSDSALLKMVKNYIEQSGKSIKNTAARNSAIDDISVEFEKYLSDPEMGRYDPAQITVNQSLSAELSGFLKNMTYKDIIDYYEDKLTDKDIDPLMAQGYEDMIAIVKNRIYDPAKRLRTDLSAKQLSSKAREEDTTVQMSEEDLERWEQERLKTLDALAPIFGFKNANGLRQWRMKFPETVFKVVLGGSGGMDAFKKYSEQVYDYLSTLLDNLSDIVAILVEDLEEEVEENPDDEDSTKVLEVLQQVDIDLVELKEKRSQNDAENLDIDMLLGSLGGKILRQVFSQTFYRPQFIDYARLMKRHMTKFLIGLGVDTTTAGKFSKMFNGEVALRRYDATDRQMQKIRAGGLDIDQYRSALEEAQQFNKDFFGPARLKSLQQKYTEFIRNPEKLTSAIFSAIPDVAQWSQIERDFPQLQVSDEGNISEQLVKKIINGMV